MKYIAICIPNTEKIVITEIKELLKVKAKKVLLGRIEFSTDKIDSLKNIQSVNTIYELIASFKFKKEQDIYTKIKKVDFSFIEDPFVVRCNREGNHKFTSLEIERSIGEIVYKQKHKVNLNEPKTTIYADILDDNLFIGKLIFNNLSKRKYKIRTTNSSINPCLAYDMVRFAEVSKENSILDPFCKDATILIEAGLFGVKTLYGFDTLNNLQSSRLNSKVAKIKINLSYENLSWISTKIKSVTNIITILSFPSNNLPEEQVKRIYSLLFSQINIVLKKGTITVLCQKPELFTEFALKNKYKPIKKLKIKSGDLNYTLINFKKAI